VYNKKIDHVIIDAGKTTTNWAHSFYTENHIKLVKYTMVLQQWTDGSQSKKEVI
jgi:hypothetical protein